MNKTPITKAIDGWVASRKYPKGPLEVSFEGKKYNWLDDFVYVSTVSSLNFCTYQLGLTAKIWEESGLLPVPDEELQKMGKIGTNNHEVLGDSYNIPKDMDFSLPEVKLSPRKALRKILQGKAPTREFPICQKFKDIVIRGRIDYLSFNTGLPNIEEWKFPKNGRTKSTHIVQTKIYAYLMHSWLGVIDFPYTIKAWPQESWSKTDEILSEEPTGVHTEVFTQDILKEVEGVLNTTNDFFTGKKECVPISDFCVFCPVKEGCKYYEKRPWVEGKLISFSGKEAIISFKEVY